MRNKFLAILAGGAMATMLASSASAVLIASDSNSHNTDMDLTGGGGPSSVDDTWSFSTALFGTHTITSVVTTFTFSNSSGDEDVRIEVGQNDSPTELNTVFTIPSSGSTITVTPTFTSASALWSDLLDDMSNGVLSYQVTLLNTSGTDAIKFKTASIDIYGDLRTSQTPGVPDGGATALLLGMGVLGLFGLKRGVRA